MPTINIGDRQRGRLQAESIINCKTDSQSIAFAIKKAMSEEFKKKCQKVNALYGDGHAAEKIAKKAIEVIMQEKVDIKKKFYDLN